MWPFKKRHSLKLDIPDGLSGSYVITQEELVSVDAKTFHLFAEAIQKRAQASTVNLLLSVTEKEDGSILFEWFPEKNSQESQGL